MQVIQGSWAVEEVEVAQLADGAWRVSDLSQREEDGLSILGVVESTGLGYEATEVRNPSVRHAFATLDQAVRFLACAVTAEGNESSRPTNTRSTTRRNATPT
jgi:hypothetical protein